MGCGCGGAKKAAAAKVAGQRAAAPAARQRPEPKVWNGPQRKGKQQ